MTARRKDFKKETIKWLKKHNIKYNNIFFNENKEEFVQYKTKIIDNIKNVLFIVEDDEDIVRELRNKGYKVLQPNFIKTKKVIKIKDKYSNANKLGGIKFDSEKPDWSLVDLSIIEDTVKVLTYGAKKYDRHNYNKVEPYRYLGALMRHITRWQSGEILDEETGIHHLSHAMANILILLRLEKKGIKYNKDD